MAPRGKRPANDPNDSDESNGSNIEVKVEPNWKAKVDDLQQQLRLLQTQLSASNSLERAITAASQAKLPPIPLVDPKLDGKLTYRTWSTNIEAVAQSIPRIWDIIKNKSGDAPAQEHQYARSLLVLNVNPAIQMEVRNQTSPSDIWTHLLEHYGSINSADVTASIRRLRKIQWTKQSQIETFYHKFKEAQSTIQEVTSQPLQEQVLISFLLCAVEKYFKEFVTMESQLPQRTVLEEQQTFESVFGRFRMEYYRQKSRDEEEDEDEAILRVSAPKRLCSICKRAHGTTCYVQEPDLAPPHSKAYYTKWHDSWKKGKEQDKDTEAKTPAIVE